MEYGAQRTRGGISLWNDAAYALQRTGVAELGVVRRLLACSE